MLIKLADNPSLGRITNTWMIKTGFRKLSAGWSNAWKTIRWGLVRIHVQPWVQIQKVTFPYYKRGETAQCQWSEKDVWDVRLTEARNGPPVSHEREWGPEKSPIEFWLQPLSQGLSREHPPGQWKSENLPVGGIGGSKTCFAWKMEDLDHDSSFK